MDEPIVVKAKIIPPKPVPKPVKVKRIWDNYQVIGAVRKSDKIKVIVAAAVRDGVRYLNIREFYFKKADNVWKPGRDGITMPLMIPISNGTKIIRPYEGFNSLLAKAAEAAMGLELFDEANAVYYYPKEETKKNED